ncbi:MAG: ATP-binding protein [Flavobacteriales bacterium]|nr:ATP-binding protein [Flavobacteriales bacterium]
MSFFFSLQKCWASTGLADSLKTNCIVCHPNRFDTKIKNREQTKVAILGFHKIHQLLDAENHEEAMIYSNLCVSNWKENQHSHLLHYTYLVRGRLFHELEFFEKAIDCYKEAIQLSDRHSFELFPFAKFFLCDAYIDNNEERKAIAILENENLESHQVSMDIQQAIYTNKGLCYRRLGNFEAAEENLLDAYEINLEHGQIEQLSISCIGLANHYYDLYEDSLAKEYFKKGYEYSLQTQNYALVRDAVLNLAIVAENESDYESALNYRKDYENWIDSVWNQTRIWELAESEKKLELGFKEREINLIEREKEFKERQLRIKNKQERILITFLVILLVFFLTSIFFFWRSVKRNRVIESQRQKLGKLNETKNRILSVVAHDLRSPVQKITETNEEVFELANLNADPHQIKELLRSNQVLGHRTQNLIENLLNWSLEQSDQYYFQIEKVPLKRIVDQVIYNFSPLLNSKKLTFICQISNDIYLSADPNSLKIILRNLMDNAIKYTESGGVIELNAQRVNDSHCYVIVQDSGIGMSSDVCQRVLLPGFFSKERDTSGRVGTGLGLRLCSSLMERNSGELKVESEKGKGTRIELKLKLA